MKLSIYLQKNCLQYKQGVRMKLKTKTSPIENKMLLLLGLEGLSKEKIKFEKSKKGNGSLSYFRYLNWLPLKKQTIDYLKYIVI